MFNFCLFVFWTFHYPLINLFFIVCFTSSRSVAANASDSLYCMLLAQNAVHGAMAGYTAFSTGLINNRVVFIPITRLVATSPRVMDPIGRTWERVLSMTRQPKQEPTFDTAICTVNDRTIVG